MAFLYSRFAGFFWPLRPPLPTSRQLETSVNQDESIYTQVLLRFGVDFHCEMMSAFNDKDSTSILWRIRHSRHQVGRRRLGCSERRSDKSILNRRSPRYDTAGVVLVEKFRFSGRREVMPTGRCSLDVTEIDQNPEKEGSKSTPTHARDAKRPKDQILRQGQVRSWLHSSGPGSNRDGRVRAAGGSDQ